MSLTVDARGLRCPWPVLRLAKAMREAETVTILADDPMAPDELAALAATNGWAIRPSDGGFCVSRAGR